MKKKNKHIPEMKKLNYASFSGTTIDLNPDDIPTLIPEKTLKEWQEGDTNPYYKIQKIEYPIIANGYNYVESFFESFVSKLNERPIAGSKAGHETNNMKRPPTDLIMIGAKIEKTGDGKGFVYFKNYIPPEGDTGSNEIFIRENKSDMVHYSLVSWTRDEVEWDEDDNMIVNVVESVMGERNDAVSYGMGAMEQKTNQGLNPVKQDEDNKDKEKNLTKEEILKELASLKANANKITLLEIAEAMGKGEQIVTDEHLEAVKVFNSLKEAGIENPVEEIKALKEKVQKDAEAVRNARLDNAFGVDTDNKNYLRQYAEKQCNEFVGEELEQKINELKEDPIAIKLAAERADVNSETNEIIGISETEDDKKSNSKKRVDRI